MVLQILLPKHGILFRGIYICFSACGQPKAAPTDLSIFVVGFVKLLVGAVAKYLEYL